MINGLRSLVLDGSGFIGSCLVDMLLVIGGLVRVDRMVQKINGLKN